MKKLILSLLSLLMCSNLFAAEVNQIVFFGDSLSDNGNLYNLIRIVPKSPPYFEGRFSNGPVWSEMLASHYHDKINTSSKVYAYGGATALYHNPTDKFMALMTLRGEIYQYNADNYYDDKSKILYVIWIGANDYLFDENSDPEVLTKEVVEEISWSISLLINNGATHFLILNLPDLSQTPYATLWDMSEHLQQLSLMHNQKLSDKLQSIRESNPGVKIYTLNIQEAFTDLVHNPDKYNQKYSTKFTNVDKVCWQGGLTLVPNKVDRNTLKAELQKVTQSNNAKVPHFNPNILGDFIYKSPELREAYQLGKKISADSDLCDKPDEYVFWDFVHPSSTVHQILAAVAIDALNDQAKGALSN